MGVAASALAIMDVCIPAHPQANSSLTRADSRIPRPPPPYSAGIPDVRNPASNAFFMTSSGKASPLSICAARGLISAAANSRAISWRAFCSSVGSKSIIEPPRSGVFSSLAAGWRKKRQASDALSPPTRASGSGRRSSFSAGPMQVKKHSRARAKAGCSISSSSFTIS